MLLIIFLCLITKLALVSGECDLGTPTLDDFDYIRFSGPRLWYVLSHNDTTGNNFDCYRTTYGIPEGNRSLFTYDAYNISQRNYITFDGYITNWNSTGYLEVSHNLVNLNGRSLIKAVDYDHYFIGRHCLDEIHEALVSVGYRSLHPDQETVNEVHRELQDKNVNVSQLVVWSVDHCPQAESSEAGGSAVQRHWPRK